MLHFVYNSPSSTCACRIICMQEILAKMGQNGDKYGLGRQVDMAGAQGPTCYATWPHKGATQPPKWPYHVPDLWELLQKQC